MADNTTDTNTTDHDATTATDTQTTPVPSNGTVLDLRPPADSIKAELHRLGLTYESATDTVETWRDYPAGLMAVIGLPDDATVTLTDVATGIDKTLTLDQLRTVTKVLTVASRQNQQ